MQENLVCAKEEEDDLDDADADAGAVFDEGVEDLLDVRVKSENDAADDFVSPICAGFFGTESFYRLQFS